MKLQAKYLGAGLSLAFCAISAHALTPGSGTWVKETATYGTPNLQDAYVYVPSNANPAVKDGKRALMLTLHGCGQTASGNVIDNKFNWPTTAEQYGMVIVAPTVPSGTSSTRTSSGCWDWFGSNHNRTSRDAVPLKKLIDAVKARTNLDIDINQIYITGLSSGAGETHVIGCTFPDYFAGIGENAGPALGSSATAIFSDPTVTASQIVTYCKAMNGNNATYNAFYNTQLYNTVYGTNDSLVKPSHNVRNAEGMRQLYGTTSTATSFTVSGGGNGTMYKDANGKERVSLISVTGMAHAWPAGSGGSGGGQYVDYTKINYPAWVTAWFFNNNLRVSGGGGTTTTTAAGTTTTTAAATTTTTTATTTTTTAAGTCYTANNVAHVTALRASVVLGVTYALGSNQNMGLYNILTTTKLRKTGTNYYVIDNTCP
ncbi:MAG TPA: PHB depolymerase family esterase [Rhodocyclaceae bacterium]|nr:PHB depolymerase family esterase [Rhodocyclaceae bacterium]